MKIIAAMIIGNDSMDFVFRSIEAVKKLVDGVVVDYNGKDEEVLNYLNDNCLKVDCTEWTNDYSHHRNNSIKMAEDVGADWIFIYDADEELCFEKNKDAQIIKSMIGRAKEEEKAFGLILHDIQSNQDVMQMNTPRIFKRGNIQYRLYRHNMPLFKGPLVIIKEIYLKHYGYCSEALGEARYRIKQESRTEALLKMVEDFPKEYHVLFYLNQNYSILGDYEKCVEYGLKYIKNRKEIGKSFNQNAYFTTLRGLIKLNSKKTALKLLDDALTEAKPDLDLALIMVEVGYWTGRQDLITIGATNYIKFYEIYQKDPSLSQHQFVFTFNIDSLAYCVAALALTFFQQGSFHLKNLSNIWSGLNPAMKENLSLNLRNNFESFETCKLMQDFNLLSIFQANIDKPVEKLKLVGG